MSRQLLSFGGPFLRRRANPLAAHAIGGVVPDVLYYPPGGLFYVDGAAVDAADIITLAGGVTMDANGIYISSAAEAATLNDALRLASDFSAGVNIAMDGFVTYADNGSLQEFSFYQNPAGAPYVRTIIRTDSTKTGLPASLTNAGSGGSATAYPGAEQIAPGTDVPFSFAARHMPSTLQSALNGTLGTAVAGTGAVSRPGSIEFGDLVAAEQRMTIWRIRMWFGDVLGSGGIEEASGPFSI